MAGSCCSSSKVRSDTWSMRWPRLYDICYTVVLTSCVLSRIPEHTSTRANTILLLPLPLFLSTNLHCSATLHMPDANTAILTADCVPTFSSAERFRPIEARGRSENPVARCLDGSLDLGISDMRIGSTGRERSSFKRTHQYPVPPSIGAPLWSPPATSRLLQARHAPTSHAVKTRTSQSVHRRCLYPSPRPPPRYVPSLYTL